MLNKMKLPLYLLLVLPISACISPGPRTGGHQPDLDCPAHLTMYCGGWTVYDSNVDHADEHMVQNDRFVIGRKSSGIVPLSLFPRNTSPDNLLVRWKGQTKIDLQERTKDDGTHDCMVGRVRLTDHPGNGSAHEWHALTLRVEQVEYPEIGVEDNLVVCMNIQQGGGWPDACAPLNCEYEDSQDPRNHGGRAHAND